MKPFASRPPGASCLHSLGSRWTSLCFAAGVLMGSSALLQAGWPEFRGPTGDGHSSETGLPLTWSESENVSWKTPIPYKGWCAPAVLDGQVWVSSAEADGHDFYAIGLDADTGKILHNVHLFHSEDPEPLGNGASMNSYATPSSFLEKGRVYVHFGSFGTACLDTITGKVLWKRSDLPCRHYRGASSSIVSHGDLIILTFDGADLQYHAALDKATGRTIWKTDRSVEWNDEDVQDPMVKDGDWRKAHSTPLVVNDGGRGLMLSAGAKAAYGYDPASGRELWRVEYQDWSTAPCPLYQNGVAYFVTGLRLKEMWAVRTDKEGVLGDEDIIWKLKTHVGKYASPLLVDGLIYTAAEQSFVTCLDAATGETIWKERIQGSFAASPVYADGRLYFFSQEGITTVIQPGREFKVLATNKLDDGFMASPAVSDKAFFLRTKTHLYRIQRQD